MSHLLLIEDDQLQSKLYADRFTSMGYTVAVAYDGEEGLRHAFLDHPRLIILDLNLPRLDGMALLAKLRSDEWGKDVPVIILTGQEPDDAMLKEILEHKPAYYLLKSSTSVQEVSDKVKSMLHL